MYAVLLPALAGGRTVQFNGQADHRVLQFINSAANRNIARVEHGLSSVTDKEVKIFIVENPNATDPRNPRSKITLVETPGLNNTGVLRLISEWLNDELAPSLIRKLNSC